MFVQFTRNQADSEEHLRWWLETNQHEAAIDEDLDDTVLVHNKTTMLEESLVKTVEENELLKISQGNYEVEVTMLKQQLKSQQLKKESDIQNVEALKKCTSEKIEIEQRCSDEVTVLNDKLKTFEEHEFVLKQNVVDLTSQIKDMKEHLTIEYEEKLKHCYESIETLSDDRNRILIEKQTVQTKLDEEKKSCKEKIESLLQEQASKIKLISDECVVLKKIVRNEKDQNRKLENDYQEMVLSLTSQLQSTLGKETHRNEETIAKISALEMKLGTTMRYNSQMSEEINNLTEVLETTKTENMEKEKIYNSKKNEFKHALQVKADILDELAKDKKCLIYRLGQK